MLRDQLQSSSESGNFTSNENFHLTLVFIGECDAEKVNKVKSIIDEVNFNKFTIDIDRVGSFKRDGGDTWWAGVGVNKTLSKLQSDLTSKLLEAGFSVSNEKYNPHITLGRKVDTITKPWLVQMFSETIYSYDLIKSDRINDRVVYKSIYNSERK